MTTSTRDKSPHATLVEIASKLGVDVQSLLVLARSNDPFLAGTSTHWLQAEWFAALWQRHIPTGSRGHLRRLHYVLVAHSNVQLWDGTPYENSGTAWGKLKVASRYARYLGLVAPDELIDERMGEPQLFTLSREPPPVFATSSMANVCLPWIDAQLFPGNFTVPHVGVTGYDYSDADQPYHIELWIEKSTMNDVLLPLCRQYGVNLIVGTGTMSITAVVGLLKRAAQHGACGKATRLFYLSDFDRAGDAMPRQVSRQIEFWRDRYAPDTDIRLLPLVLTGEQVDRYTLPNAPGESAEHNRRFEERQQRGVVELDALEALVPGELGRIVEAAFAPYVDTELADALHDAEKAAEAEATRLWEEQTEVLRRSLAAVAAEVTPIGERYQTQLAELAKALDEELAPQREQLRLLKQVLAELVVTFDPELPERPGAVRREDDGDPWLYDSERNYLKQLACYHRHRDGSSGEV